VAVDSGFGLNADLHPCPSSACYRPTAAVGRTTKPTSDRVGCIAEPPDQVFSVCTIDEKADAIQRIAPEQHGDVRQPYTSGALALLAAAGAPWLMRAFTHDPAVIEAAQTLLWISLALETGRVANLVVFGALRSTGDVILPVSWAIASIVTVLGFGSILMGPWWGLVGIWIAYAADEWIRGALMFWRWETHGWVGHARAIHERLRSPGVESRF
jgi:hypothetical protein